MMHNLHFMLLVGLPGSGKTVYGNRCEDQDIAHRVFLDDLTQKGGLTRLFNVVANQKPEIVIISDHDFIHEDVRKAAIQLLTVKYPESTFDFMVWVNDPAACWENIQYRDDGRIITRESVGRDSKEYTYPLGVVSFQPVYKSTGRISL